MAKEVKSMTANGVVRYGDLVPVQYKKDKIFDAEGRRVLRLDGRVPRPYLDHIPTRRRLVASLTPIFEDLGLRSVALFGSWSRNEHSWESDVDLLVESGPSTPVKRTHDGMVYDVTMVEEMLESVIEQRIDVTDVTAYRRSDDMQRYVERDLIPIYRSMALSLPRGSADRLTKMDMDFDIFLRIVAQRHGIAVSDEYINVVLRDSGNIFSENALSFWNIPSAVTGEPFLFSVLPYRYIDWDFPFLFDVHSMDGEPAAFTLARLASPPIRYVHWSVLSPLTGRSLAHETYRANRLPDAFGKWNIQDRDGRTLKEIVQAERKYPDKYFELWKLFEVEQ